MQIDATKSVQSGQPRKHQFNSAEFRCLAAAALCVSSFSLRAVAAEIDDVTTQPVATSTADAEAADEIIITEDGEIDISGQPGTAAVTVDSDHDVTNSGTIVAEDTDTLTGIRITGNRVATITNDGSIQLIEDYDREDEDDDDDLDGPLAIGSDRVAIQLDNGSTLTGDLILTSGSSIRVEGNNSAGILALGAIDGSFRTDGSLFVIGDDALGIALDQDVSQDVLISGGVGAQGENATALRLGGTVSGTLTIESSVSSTGFSSTGQTNYVSPTNTTEDTPPVDERLDPDDLYDNTVSVHIGGSVAGGVLINGAVDTFTSEEDQDDETKDTLDDFDENRSAGNITSYGSGAALEITPDTAGEDIRLGPVFETVRDTLDDDEDDDTDEFLAQFQLDQGLINRGTIAANGINIGFDATAVDIFGREDGTGRVIIDGGILNRGSISATAYEANATALRLGTGTDAGAVTNTGSIAAVTYTRSANSATALLVESGSTIGELTNKGTISARSVGFGGQVAAIRDNSDTLTSIINNGAISARVVSDGRTDDGNGTAIAFDLSSQSSGATVTQARRTPVDDVNGDGDIDDDDVATPSIVGEIRFGSGDDALNVLAGSITGDVLFGDGDAAFRLQNASMTGDSFFDGDTFLFTLSNSELSGDIFLADADGSLIFQQGSEFEGNLFSGAASSLTLQVDNSDLALLDETDLHLSTLSVAGESTLTFEISPQKQRTAPFITVSGLAEFGASTVIQPSMSSIVATDFSTILVDAGDLQFEGELSTVATDNLPWIYNVDLVTAGDNNNQLVLDFRLKTSEELGFDVNQASAFDAVLEVAVGDDDVGAALASITEGTPFLVSYNLLLPQRTEGSTRFLETQQNAVFGALSSHLDLIRAAPANRTSFWAEETFSHVDAKTTSSSPGYDGRGIGLALGVERPLMGVDTVGLMLSLNNGRFEEKTGGINPVTTSSLGLGAYASERLGPVDAQLAVQYSDVGFSSTRRVVMEDYVSDVSGDWDGSSFAASARLSNEFGQKLIRVTPYASIDYFTLSQDAYSETGTAGLNLAVSESETDRLTASGGVSLAATWNWSQSGFDTGTRQQVGDAYGNQSTLVRASLDLGYRSVLSSTPYEVEANFVGYDTRFLLSAQDEVGDAFTAGLSFLAASEFLSVRFGAGGEFARDATSLNASANVRVQF